MDFAWVQRGGPKLISALTEFALVNAEQLQDPGNNILIGQETDRPVAEAAVELGVDRSLADEMLTAGRLGWVVGEYEKYHRMAPPGFTHYFIHNGLCRIRQMFPQFGLSEALATSYALEIGYFVSRSVGASQVD